MQVHTHHQVRILRDSGCILHSASPRQHQRDTVVYFPYVFRSCKRQPSPRGRVCMSASGADASEALISDYMGCLKDYRAMQKASGAKAAQQARELSSSMHVLVKEEVLIQAAQVAGVDVKQLVGLIAMRSRLLHDLPVIKARLAGRVEAQQPGNCNHDGASLATRQWAHAKQYRHNIKKETQQSQQHSHASGSRQNHSQGGHVSDMKDVSPTPQPINGNLHSAAVPGSSWIQTLGFSDMVQHSHDAVVSLTSDVDLEVVPGVGPSTSSQPATAYRDPAVEALGQQPVSVDSSNISIANQALHIPIGPHVDMPVASCASRDLPSNSTVDNSQGHNIGHSNGTTHVSQPFEAHVGVSTPGTNTPHQPQSSNGPSSAISSMCDANVSSSVSQQQSNIGTVTVPQQLNPLDPELSNTAPSSVSSYSHQSQGANSQQAQVECTPNSNTIAEEPATTEVPYGAPARLQSALLSALKYKQQKRAPTQNAAGQDTAADASSKAPDTPPEFVGLTLQQTVERAKFDVESFTRNCRANPEEAALLICP